MPLTKAGSRTLREMQAEYGSVKGKKVFYASLNAGRLDRDKMEGKTRRKKVKRKRGSKS